MTNVENPASSDAHAAHPMALFIILPQKERLECLLYLEFT
jgi:hypothetical protein